MNISRQQSRSKYGPNNPEPAEFKDSQSMKNQSHDALHAAAEYINHETSSVEEDESQLPCKNSVPT
ncbi:MAG: hypothetical protein P4N59_12505 [Negativicutes bacterium]|nr:hypothetical protein [Negativicutes bacterium]